MPRPNGPAPPLLCIIMIVSLSPTCPALLPDLPCPVQPLFPSLLSSPLFLFPVGFSSFPFHFWSRLHVPSLCSSCGLWRAGVGTDFNNCVLLLSDGVYVCAGVCACLCMVSAVSQPTDSLTVMLYNNDSKLFDNPTGDGMLCCAVQLVFVRVCSCCATFFPALTGLMICM